MAGCCRDITFALDAAHLGCFITGQWSHQTYSEHRFTEGRVESSLG